MKKLTKNDDRERFYSTLIEKIGTEVYTNVQIYSLIENTLKEFEVSTHNTGYYFTRLQQILGESNYELVEDTTLPPRKGPGRKRNGFLFSINPKYLKREKKTTPEEKIEIEPITGEKKKESTSRKPRVSRTELTKPRLAVVDKVWKLHTYYIKNDLKGMSLEEVSKVVGIYYTMTKAQLENWFNICKSLGITVGLGFGPGKKRVSSYTVFLTNPKNGLISISETMRDKFGIKSDFDATPYVGKKVTETTFEDLMKLPKETKEKLWYIAGVIMRLENKKENFHEICTFVRRLFGVDITTTQLPSLLKPITLFDLSRTDTDRVCLKEDEADNGKKAYEMIKATCSPFAYRKETLIRMGLPLPEIEKYLPCELISEITPTEGIYRVYYSESLTDRINLGMIAQLMRDRDMFLTNPELKDLGLKTLAEMKGELMKVNPLYGIENL